MAPRHTALVAGATGATSKRLVELLATDPDWAVVGLCRNPPAAPPPGRVVYRSVDLTDGRQVGDAIAAHPEVTHIFYCCRAKHGESGVESVEDNVAMLAGLLDAALTHATGLAHVHLIEGGKWYGMHLGAFPTPAFEDDPRHLPPNFYYDQEDLMRARQKGAAWTWSASRPNFIIDVAPERPRNLVAVLGAWAAFCRECHVALDYPGTATAYAALSDLTDATHFARALRFIATQPQCANEAFNVTNGEPIRWNRLWPRLAALYDLPVGMVRPMRLGEWMADKQPLWTAMVAQYDLVEPDMARVVLWPFADFALNQGHDVFYSNTKLRAAGFTESVDTIATLIDQIATYRRMRILP